MRRVPLTVTLILPVLLLSSCANNSPSINTPKTTNEIASWPYPYVKVEDRVYVIENDENKVELVEKENIGEQIGTVKEKYELEEDERTWQPTIASNYLEKGTKLFAIKDVDPTVHIAFEKSEGVFVKATEESAVPKESTDNTN
ncbi:hypothetical protein [uncultured Brevibacillus sp.]|uniref:hypothetical protein n=1 Tax=uncultured Brevibacillus sp. TaxID=169970 RepID=UPI0025979F45|nr:hypothetical protein [uncultured Brevibacillus sp.]